MAVEVKLVLNNNAMPEAGISSHAWTRGGSGGDFYTKRPGKIVIGVH
jgi:hypothetical protein